jgi:hypothetical protein
MFAFRKPATRAFKPRTAWRLAFPLGSLTAAEVLRFRRATFPVRGSGLGRLSPATSNGGPAVRNSATLYKGVARNATIGVPVSSSHTLIVVSLVADTTRRPFRGHGHGVDLVGVAGEGVQLCSSSRSVSSFHTLSVGVPGAGAGHRAPAVRGHGHGGDLAGVLNLRSRSKHSIMPTAKMASRCTNVRRTPSDR